jgi:UDP-N-acetylmuramate dehydrogenase
MPLERIPRGDAGVHPDQSLVLVNYGSATGQEILDLAEDIRMSVLEKFDVMLEIEVNIL